MSAFSITYEVQPGTPAAEAWETMRAADVAFRDHVRDAVALYGLPEGTAPYVNTWTGEITGFDLHPKPKGWVGGLEGVRPPLRSAAARAQWEAVTAVKRAGHFLCNRLFLGVEWLVVGYSYYGIGLHEACGRRFVVVDAEALQAEGARLIEGLVEVPASVLLNVAGLEQEPAEAEPHAL